MEKWVASILNDGACKTVLVNTFAYITVTQSYFFYVFLSKSRKSHAENSAETTKNPYCKVLENRSYLLTSFDPELFLPWSLSPCLWVMRQASQDQRAARVCCPWGCSCHLLQKLDGRQGGGNGWEEEKLSWRRHGQLQPNRSSATVKSSEPRASWAASTLTCHICLPWLLQMWSSSTAPPGTSFSQNISSAF